MQTIYLDASKYATPQALHEALKVLLNLPSYYGCNADALNDCLSERPTPLRLWIASRGEGKVARALDLICQVVRDNGGTVKEL